jgi:hypothetical protein
VAVRVGSLVAGFALALTVVMSIAAVVLGWGSGPGGVLRLWDAVGSLVGVVTVALGALLVVRRPGNAIGWLLCVAGVAYGLLMLTWQHATNVVDQGTAVDDPAVYDGLAVASVWAGTWIWTPIILVLLLLIPLRFPDGHLVSARWRAAEIASYLTLGTIATAEIIRPGPLLFEGRVLPVDNPVGVVAMGPVLDGMVAVGIAAMLALMSIAFASLVVRYRRSDTVVRHQIKWLVYGLALVLVLLAASDVVPWLGWLSESFNVVLIVVPVSIAVAVLRHGLYEIDRIISRSVAWAILTAVLIGLYAATALVLGSATRAVMGSEQADLVVVASTLLAAAAFQPARRRIQAAVDRRFNRARYDAARTVDAFARVVRDEVELDAVTAALRDAASRTVQPFRVQVWVRDH